MGKSQSGTEKVEGNAAGAAMSEPQKHCDHECVCPDFFTPGTPCDGIFIPNIGMRENCPHDTRLSHSAAGESAAEQCPHWKKTDNLKSDCRDQRLRRYYCAKPETAAEQRIRDVIAELESALDTGYMYETDEHVRRAIALLRKE